MKFRNVKSRLLFVALAFSSVSTFASPHENNVELTIIKSGDQVISSFSFKGQLINNVVDSESGKLLFFSRQNATQNTREVLDPQSLNRLDDERRKLDEFAATYVSSAKLSTTTTWPSLNCSFAFSAPLPLTGHLPTDMWNLSHPVLFYSCDNGAYVTVQEVEHYGDIIHYHP